MIIRRTLAVILLCDLLAACASSGPPGPEITEHTRQKQEVFIGSIYPGQSVDEIRTSIGSIAENFFEILEGGVLHQYIQARHPKTDMLFGLYFENGILTGMLLDQDVTDFNTCRASVTKSDVHWLSAGFSPYRTWIMDRNRLEGGIPDAVQDPKPPEEGGYGFGEYVEAISMAQVLIIALPLYGVDQLTGGMQRDAKSESEHQYLIETASNIHIGLSEERLVYLMGQHDRRDSAGPVKIYTYLKPSYSFGVKDGKVVWKESASMFSGSMLPGNAFGVTCPVDCGSLGEIRENGDSLSGPQTP